MQLPVWSLWGNIRSDVVSPTSSTRLLGWAAGTALRSNRCKHLMRLQEQQEALKILHTYKKEKEPEELQQENFIHLIAAVTNLAPWLFRCSCAYLLFSPTAAVTSIYFSFLQLQMSASCFLIGVTKESFLCHDMFQCLFHSDMKWSLQMASYWVCCT